MRRSKSYEVRDPMNIWNKYDFAMSGLGKKSKILAKIKHFFKCVKWSKQRITRGYCDCDVWEMFSFLQTLIPDMLQTLKDTRTGSPGYLGENYTNENGILVNDTCHEEWNCILDKMIFLWREAEKDTCSQKNPFDEAHSKAMDEFTEIIYVFLTIFLYLLKCPQSLILSALRAFCFCGKPHISRSIFLYFRYQAWLKSW